MSKFRIVEVCTYAQSRNKAKHRIVLLVVGNTGIFFAGIRVEDLGIRVGREYRSIYGLNRDYIHIHTHTHTYVYKYSLIHWFTARKVFI